jgi:hypothetical protein
MERHPMAGWSEYKVIEGLDLRHLVREVNGAIKNGWQPLAGVCTNGRGNYYQAMVR